MSSFPEPLDLRRLKIHPLAQRQSLSSIEKILVDPAKAPTACPPPIQQTIRRCARNMVAARQRNAGCVLMYGAHLIKNGALQIVNALVRHGWITHLATNGAGSIHDWELAFLGRTEESVKQNVATGTFGTWDETGRNIHLALATGALREEGYGRSLGRFVVEGGTLLPEPGELENALHQEPSHPLAPARAELLQMMRAHGFFPGFLEVNHPWRDTCILAQAFRRNLPLTVHPGIGYDIITNHPIFSGAVIGRAADLDFRLFSRALDGLDDGVVFSVGSAVMAPQVFEKSLSCVNNLRLQAGRSIVRRHTFYVVDIQDGGRWDWSAGEPPKDNPAYYLRFCKSFSRMGGVLNYVQCDNVMFLHNLLRELERHQRGEVSDGPWSHRAGGESP